MKKLWSLYVIVLLIATLILVGCPEKDEGDPEPTPEPTPELVIEPITVFATEIMSGATLVTDSDPGVSSGATITTYESEDAIAVSAYNSGTTIYENRMRINFEPALDLTDYTTISLRTNMDNSFSYIKLITTGTVDTLITNWHGTQTGWFSQSYILADQPTEVWAGTAWTSTTMQLTGMEFWSDKDGIDTTAYITDIIFE